MTPFYTYALHHDVYIFNAVRYYSGSIIIGLQKP